LLAGQPGDQFPANGTGVRLVTFDRIRSKERQQQLAMAAMGRRI
jgi:hypothetical protein